MDKKTELRARAKELRKSLDVASISSGLCDKIFQNELYKTSKNVMIFYPKKYEVDLRKLLSDDKNFYLPRACGSDLAVCPYKIGDDLSVSEFGVSEPLSEKVSPDILDLVIVPALLADKNGYRLGYGGGYYDRFLKVVPDVKTICALPKELLVETLSCDDNDVKVDVVITY